MSDDNRVWQSGQAELKAIKALADKVKSKGLVVGSVVAPVWFDAAAGGDATARANWVNHVRKAVRIAKKLRDLGVRKMRLLSSPMKFNAISGFDLEVVEYLPAE